MAATGKITDAVPFGLVAAALYNREDTHTARIRAEERYLAGQSPEAETMQAFGEAAESLVTRWTDNGHAPLAAAMCERAERMLADLGGRAAAGESKVLEAGLDARFAALAEALANGDLAVAEEALSRVHKHGRAKGRDAEIQAADCAVRLARWLATTEEPPATLADGATRMLRSWAWADRALAVISRADTARVPRLASVYASIWERARARRAHLDEAFARKLAAWSHGSVPADGLLLVENVLELIARPVATERLPVIIVLDGMTAAIGCELAEEIVLDGLWMEVGRRADGREPALATIPSITAISRTSLLTGTLRSGGQPEERAGFGAFWSRRKSRLFHKVDLLPEPGQSLASEVRDAIGDPDTVVGVVLNTIDDMLANERPGGPAHWEVNDVNYLRAILNEPRRASRPVILTADHGHVLDRGHPPATTSADSARYRGGTPGPGEIAVRGPRVLTAEGKPGGEVVAAVDEAIRYTPREAGYHGGASAAEVVVPAIALLPSASLLPTGWVSYDPQGHAPIWWEVLLGRVTQAQEDMQQPPATRSASSRRGKRQAPPPVDSAALFDVAEVVPGPVPSESPMAPKSATLGARVATSARMASQRQFVRRAPGDASVAALIDALIAAGGRLTLAEAAEAAGEPAVRMSGYLAQVSRLLNVDSYPVIQQTDNGRTVELNQQLLRQQFLTNSARPLPVRQSDGGAHVNNVRLGIGDANELASLIGLRLSS